jgi:hypothetical protein
MIVIAHLAIRVAEKGVALNDVGQESQESVSIYLVDVDACSADAAGDDVICQPWSLDSERSGHVDEPFTGRASMKCSGPAV